MWWTIAVALAAKVSKDQQAVEAAFKDYAARAAAFDPKVVDLFTDQATITTERDGRRMALAGSEWKVVAAQTFGVAQARGDVDTYTEVTVAPTEAMGRWRVSAVRHNAVRCTTDPAFRMDFAKVDGQWRIVALHSTTTSRSQCPPYTDLPERLNALSAAIVPLLPMRLDEESELRSVAVETTVFRYDIFLATVVPEEFASVGPALQNVALSAVCSDPRTRDLLDHGASFRYRYEAAAGVVTDVTVANGDCP